MLKAQEHKAEVFDLPDWTWPVVAACVAVGSVSSPVISAIDVAGTLTTDHDGGRRLLCSLLERLAEEHNLEVVLDIEGDSFVARFSSASVLARSSHV